MCGAQIPSALASRLQRVREDEATVVQIGIEWATAQGQALLEGGAPGIHFYTLNRSHSTRDIFRNLHQLKTV